MTKTKTFCFKAETYKTGINYCVDVPEHITSEINTTRGYIRIKIRVNNLNLMTVS